MLLFRRKYGVICYLYPIIPIYSSFRSLKLPTSHSFGPLASHSTVALNLISDDKTMENVKFIDIGANLQDPMFSGFYNGKKKHESDVSRVLDRARERGVEKIIITSGSLADLRSALEICNTFDKNGGFLYTTVGVHPCMCNQFIPNNDKISQVRGFDENAAIDDATHEIKNAMEESYAMNYLDELISLARANINRIAAVGEFGLDFDRLGYCDRATQLKYFDFQMRLLDEFKLPLFLHMRNATDETIDILAKHRTKWEMAGGVCHSFTGTSECLKKVLDLGLYIGINGCSLKTADNLDNLKRIPLDRLLFETDSPWCGIKKSHASYECIKTRYDSVNKTHLVDSHPNCILNIRNEPCNMRQVAEVVHSINHYNLDFTELCNRVRSNTLKLFKHLQ